MAQWQPSQAALPFAAMFCLLKQRLCAERKPGARIVEIEPAYPSVVEQPAQDVWAVGQ
ncbi:hypothetical protein D3C72_2280120 [compost metagenome]